MLNFSDAASLIRRVKCKVFGKEFSFILESHGCDRWYLQVGMVCVDSETGDQRFYSGGKYYISPHSTRDEIIKKCLTACIQFMEHEVREGFLYSGRAIFGPHITLEALFVAAECTEERKINENFNQLEEK